jgi:hypothetical protein
MTKHPSTKSTRKHPIVAAMQVATGSRSRSGGGHALPNHQIDPSSVDVGVPAWGWHLCVPVQSAFARRGCRSEGWGAGYRKGKLSRQSRTAGTSATSSSFLSASASSWSIWPTFGRVGDATSCRSAPGAIKTIAHTAISTACSCSYGWTFAIAAVYPFTSPAIPNSPDTKRSLKSIRQPAPSRRNAHQGLAPRSSASIECAGWGVFS